MISNATAAISDPFSNLIHRHYTSTLAAPAAVKVLRLTADGSPVGWSAEFNPDEIEKGFHWAGRTGMGDSS